MRVAGLLNLSLVMGMRIEGSIPTYRICVLPVELYLPVCVQFFPILLFCFPFFVSFSGGGEGSLRSVI